MFSLNLYLDVFIIKSNVKLLSLVCNKKLPHNKWCSSVIFLPFMFFVLFQRVFILIKGVSTQIRKSDKKDLHSISCSLPRLSCHLSGIFLAPSSKLGSFDVPGYYGNLIGQCCKLSGSYILVQWDEILQKHLCSWIVSLLYVFLLSKSLLYSAADANDFLLVYS